MSSLAIKALYWSYRHHFRPSAGMSSCVCYVIIFSVLMIICHQPQKNRHPSRRNKVCLFLPFFFSFKDVALKEYKSLHGLVWLNASNPWLICYTLSLLLQRCSGRKSLLEKEKCIWSWCMVLKQFVPLLFCMKWHKSYVELIMNWIHSSLVV